MHYKILTIFIGFISFEFVASIYPDLSCQCGFTTYNATYDSRNLNKTGSITQFNDDCNEQELDCEFIRCILFSLNVLEKKNETKLDKKHEEVQVTKYSLAPEILISGHLQQAFTGSNPLKNYISTAAVTSGILQLKVPETSSCETREWDDFFEKLNHVWSCRTQPESGPKLD